MQQQWGCDTQNPLIGKYNLPFPKFFWSISVQSCPNHQWPKVEEQDFGNWQERIPHLLRITQQATRNLKESCHNVPGTLKSKMLVLNSETGSWTRTMVLNLESSLCIRVSWHGEVKRKECHCLKLGRYTHISNKGIPIYVHINNYIYSHNPHIYHIYTHLLPRFYDILFIIHLHDENTT